MATSNLVAMIAIFFIFVNLAGAIVVEGIINVDGVKVFQPQDTAGYIFSQEEYVANFTSDLEQEIRPSGSIDNRGDQIYRVLDTIGLGFILRFMQVIDKYMFGFVNMLDIIIGNHLAPGVRTIIFGTEGIRIGAFKLIITISYALFGISLFTGKDVLEGR